MHGAQCASSNHPRRRLGDAAWVREASSDPLPLEAVPRSPSRPAASRLPNGQLCMRILVTGASGFVGGSFMRRFAGREGVELFGVGRRPANFENYARIDLSGDFDIPFSPDVVIHAAARASPWGTRAEFFLQNVQATQNVVRFCERRGCPNLIYLSSSSVFYRHEHQFNLTEASPIGPTFVNEYAASKYDGELAIGRYSGATVILRPRAVFGPGDTVLFPRILRAARRGQFPLFQSVGAPAIGDLIFI